MKEKKDRERFGIKFNENDPAHEAVIRLLEKQGSHRKAQFIVNAVLHYVNCKEALDVSVAQAADKASIEKIVMKILHKRDNGQQDTQNRAGAINAEREGQKSTEPSEQRCDTESNRKEMEESTWAMIADTMLAFRNS